MFGVVRGGMVYLYLFLFVILETTFVVRHQQHRIRTLFLLFLFIYILIMQNLAFCKIICWYFKYIYMDLFISRIIDTPKALFIHTYIYITVYCIYTRFVSLFLRLLHIIFRANSFCCCCCCWQGLQLLFFVCYLKLEERKSCEFCHSFFSSSSYSVCLCL